MARIALLAWDQKQLFVDEMQYWFWGQDFAFGYFSKPPAIAWLIRAVTDLAGSDAPFWVRLPAPILHGITALLLGALAARLADGRAALWTVATYLSLPLVAVGSLLMTTDTLMFPFLVASYLLWSEAVEDGRSGLAGLAGIALGLGFLAKYAAIYYRRRRLHRRATRPGGASLSEGRGMGVGRLPRRHLAERALEPLARTDHAPAHRRQHRLGAGAGRAGEPRMGQARRIRRWRNSWFSARSCCRH